jgi:DNA-binding FrmR family transcriptional regulator
MLIASKVNLENVNALVQRSIMKGSAKDLTGFLGIASAMKFSGADSTRAAARLIALMNVVDTKTDTLKRGGIKVFEIDPKTGEKVKRDSLDILNDLNALITRKRKEGMSEQLISEHLQKAFGNADVKEGLDFIGTHSDLIKQKLADIANPIPIVQSRLTEANEKWATQLNKIKGHLDSIKNDFSFIYNLVKKPITFLANSPGATKGAAYTVAGASAATLLALSYGNIANILKGLGKTGLGIAGGVTTGKLLESSLGITPVFVTNWPGGIGGGFLGKYGNMKTAGDIAGAAGGGAAAARMGWLMTKLAPLLSIGAGAIAIPTGFLAGAGLMAYHAATDRRESREENLAAFFGATKPEVKNDIKLNINIDKNGWNASVNNMDTTTDITLSRGEMGF